MSVLVTSLDRRTHVETINRVRVIFAARLATISSAPVSIELFRLLARERPDIAHLQFPYPLGEAANYFLGKAYKTIISYQSDIIRQKYLRVVYAPLMRRVLARADRILVSSPQYMASSSVLSRFADKCTVVPLGIDPTAFETSPPFPRPPYSSPDANYASGEGEGGEARLLFVGHLRYYKGLDFLLRALCELPKAHLTVIGTGMMERAWRALAGNLGVDARVHFLGDVQDAQLPAHYAACDIFVLPSSARSEAFGMVQLEAMAAGKPVVCTELGTGTSFVNVDGETGFVVPACDAHALAAAIARLMDDSELRARMGAAARARVRTEFTTEIMVARVMRVYEQVLAKP